MSIRGVVFDFNGTLFWDTHLHNQAWDLFLEKHALRLSYEEKHQKIHGKNNRDILNAVFPQVLSPEEVRAFSIEKEMIYQELCVQSPMTLAPGAHEFLVFLQEHTIPFAIATASERINVEFYVKHLQLEHYFSWSHIIYNDGTMRSKPDPQIFLRAIEVLGAQSSETLIFEDSLSGIRAAENAEAGRIVIVNSNDDDYSRWEYQQIKDFAMVDRGMF